MESNLQSKFDHLTSNVANLETTGEKTKESLGSVRHVLLETNESYVKDKDHLTRTKSNIDQRHQTASVGKYSRGIGFFFLRARIVLDDSEGVGNQTRSYRHGKQRI